MKKQLNEEHIHESEKTRQSPQCRKGHGDLQYDSEGNKGDYINASNGPYWYCPVCIQIIQDLQEKERAEEERLKEEERIKEEERCKKIADNPEPLLEKMGVGVRHLSCSFETYNGGDKIKNICAGIVDKPNDLVLTGPAGTGKTHLAIAICREWIKKQIIKTKVAYWEDKLIHNAYFITAPDLLLQIRQAFSDKSNITEGEIVKKYADIGYLVLDDLGAEKTTEWSITTLYTIIDQRYRGCLPTIVTTNLTIEQIGQQISERIASRLSSGKVVKINAPDYRKKR